MAPKTIRGGFYVAGATNILGILLVSRGLTNELLRELDPSVFGTPGLLLICVWGLAYMALADSFDKAPKVALVFGLEKGLYVVTWVLWLASRGGELGEIWAKDWMTALFYAGYGLVDGAVGLFFVYVWAQHRKRKH